MKKQLFIILLFVYCAAACRKTYTCVCIHQPTGNKKYGEKIKTGKLGKKGFESTCKAATNYAPIDSMGNCHLE